MYDSIILEYKERNLKTKMFKAMLCILAIDTIAFFSLTNIFKLPVMWLTVYVILTFFTLFIGLRILGKNVLKIKSKMTITKIKNELEIREEKLLMDLLNFNKINDKEKLKDFIDYLEFYFCGNKVDREKWENIISTFIAFIFDTYTSNGDNFDRGIQFLLIWILFKICITTTIAIIQIFKGKYDLYYGIKNGIDTIYFNMCQKDN